MNLVYNSDAFAVVQITFDGEDTPTPVDTGPRPPITGFEIVDKLAKKGIYLDGALAQSFRQGVQALSEGHEPSVEEIDDYIAGYTQLGQQPLIVH
ncbi:BTH_I0359 family protein [Ideonella sp. YS5]|uniref:BTH_I0359 family protein n=1 Tax=Ideonella sp. YS5 TaxID=3453714 RepID=UPI003EEB3BE1